MTQDTRFDQPQPGSGDADPRDDDRDAAPIRIWVTHCPFNKQGAPVMGTFGSRVRGVVIIPVEQWTALCRQIPALAQTQFEVGS